MHRCFQEAWKSHKRIHQMGRGGAGRGGGGQDGDANDPTADEDDTPPPPPLDYLTADTSDDEWVEVSKSAVASFF